ncbi:sulfatase-like hydrolase/transferase [Flammeovirgaceae bacterium SG7u.111]|nr:sulfatase-like hydrolase/transferase [Flammeovirgaceae bacterium SG7u.132]WPO37622.1 sulfatase-like hydrolase/transferase [Flammeovirgaceae bacterium SG7u.111]
MKTKKHVFLIALFIGLVSCNLFAQEKPNIIVILTDDQGWSDVGFNGCTDIPTPALDKLASEGVVFDQGYVSAPYCSPSRAGLLTGRYQSRFGHDCNPPYIENGEEVGTPLSEVMISDYLKAGGYKTCAIGKWHLGDAQKFQPNERGFDHWFGFSAGGTNYWGFPQGNHKTIYRNKEKVDQKELSYLTDDFTEEAVSFIKENKDDPFFIYLAYNAPHAPDHTTEEYLEKTKHIEYGGRSVYGAMVAGVDAGVGAIDKTLTELGIKENTMVIFLSDNGGRAEHADNRPYRGHKGMIFEGGIRVPFVMTWPKGLEGGKRYGEPIISLDILPTALAAAGIDKKPKNKLDGVNVLPYLKEEKKGIPHDFLVWRTVNGFEYGVRKGNYKLYKSTYKDKFLLFDLSKDSYERNDIAEQNPKVVAELKEDFEKWNKDMIAPLWLDPHPENVIKEEKRLQETRRKSLHKKK